MAEQANVTPKRILMIAVDSSKQSEDAFDWCVENIKRAGDKLLVFHSHEAYFPSFPQAIGTEEWKQLVLKHENNIKELEAKYKAKCEAIPISAKIKIFSGSPGPAICKFAKQESVSCVVLGSRGHGTIRRTILGSVSSYVLHHAHVPVVVIPKPKKKFK